MSASTQNTITVRYDQPSAQLTSLISVDEIGGPTRPVVLSHAIGKIRHKPMFHN